MKINLGMYCYNKTNRKLGIGKIISFQSNNNLNIKYKNDIELVSVGNVEASNDIIDLVCKGDYVNGWKITLKSLTNDIVYAEDDEGYLIKSFKEKDIKSIITREQIEQVSYKVGEE